MMNDELRMMKEVKRLRDQKTKRLIGQKVKRSINLFASLPLNLLAFRLTLLPFILLSVIPVVHAVNPATLDLKVTVNVPLSVDIGSTAVSLGTLTEAKAMKISTGAIPVTNDSNGLTEDYLISASNTADWTISASTIGTNVFVLQALISTGTSLSPVNSDFETKFSTLSTTNSNMTFANYGFNGAEGHGNNVPAGTSKYLWFRFIAPREISQGNGVEQSITVTVTAAHASTY